MANTNYPISSQYFPLLIESEAIYVDKTQFIVPLLEKENNATYFPKATQTPNKGGLSIKRQKPL
jgi:hypothetical protein